MNEELKVHKKNLGVFSAILYLSGLRLNELALLTENDVIKIITEITNIPKKSYDL